MQLSQIGFGSNRKTRHLMPSGHKAFLVHNTRDVDLLLMHNKTFAAEYVINLCMIAEENESEWLISPQDWACRFIEEEGGNCSEGKAVGCQGHECESEGHNGVVGYGSRYVACARLWAGSRDIK